MQILDTLAIRENTVRVHFDEAVYYSSLLDLADASIATKFTLLTVAGTSGMDGQPVRPVTVVRVDLPTALDGISEDDLGTYLDLVLDRSMTPYPGGYVLSILSGNVFNEAISDSVPDTEFPVAAVHKQLTSPQVDTARPTRDFANAQTLSAVQASYPLVDSSNLGSIAPDDTGDYAFDEGEVNFKKRVLRRLVTSPGKFAHLPNYGVGIPDHGKRLAISSVLTALAAAAETQIALEPETGRVRVRAIVDQDTPGLVRFQVLVRPKIGPPVRFDVPFDAV